MITRKSIYYENHNAPEHNLLLHYSFPKLLRTLYHTNFPTLSIIVFVGRNNLPVSFDIQIQS